MSVFKDKKLFLFDGDGVLYSNKEIMPGAVEILRTLKDIGIEYALVTNNSTKSRQQFFDYLSSMQLDFSMDHIFTSSYALMTYLAANTDHRSVFVIGEQGIIDAGEINGIKCSKEKTGDQTAVVVGLDRSFCHNSLNIAMNLCKKGASFYATNTDNSLPFGKDEFRPGAGAMVASLEYCLNKPPELIAGKPYKALYEAALLHFKVSPDEAVMIGDRYETDIAGGLNSGIFSILVRTGVSGAILEEELERLHPAPSRIVSSLHDITSELLQFRR